MNQAKIHGAIPCRAAQLFIKLLCCFCLPKFWFCILIVLLINLASMLSTVVFVFLQCLCFFVLFWCVIKSPWGRFHKELGLVLGDITNLRLKLEWVTCPTHCHLKGACMPVWGFSFARSLFLCLCEIGTKLNQLSPLNNCVWKLTHSNWISIFAHISAWSKSQCFFFQRWFMR